MLVQLRIEESWCRRDLLVELPLLPDEEEKLKDLFARRCGFFTWPSVRLHIPEPPEGRWETK